MAEPFSLGSISSSVLAAEDIPELEEQGYPPFAATSIPVSTASDCGSVPRKASGRRSRTSNVVVCFALVHLAGVDDLPPRNFARRMESVKSRASVSA